MIISGNTKPAAQYLRAVARWNPKTQTWIASGGYSTDLVEALRQAAGYRFYDQAIKDALGKVPIQGISRSPDRIRAVCDYCARKAGLVLEE